MTIYYTKADEYLIDKIDEMAYRERKSRSAVILTVLERYFEGEKRLGEILVDMGKLSGEQLDDLIKKQHQAEDHRRLGEMLLEDELISEKDLHRALAVQKAENASSDGQNGA
ncbi:MAG: hypothetical protein ABEK03_09490 [Candidatus Bipolaricaulia bacterium]